MPTARHEEIVDIRVADAEGRVWLRLDGFRLRKLAGAPAAEAVDREPASQERPAMRLLVPTLVERPRPRRSLPPARRTTIIAPADDGGLGDSLAEASGHEVVRLPTTDASAIVAWAEQLGSEERVCFLDVAAQDEGGPLALLRLVKALVSAGADARPMDLLVIGRGSRSAATMGLAKAVSRELPAWRVRLVSLDGPQGPDVAARILAEPGTATGEPAVLAGDRRLEHRLAGPSAVAGGKGFKRGGTYVVVGGMGRVGRSVSAHLAERYGANLVIVGRRPMRAETELLLAAWQRGGGTAIYRPADVTERAALEAALAEAKTRFGRIDGVIHAVVDPIFGPMAQTVERELTGSLAVKTRGLVNLDEATAGLDLDFIAIFSSIGAFASFPGNVNQSSYCAGCSFEAAYAADMARRGRPARLIHWGLWQSDAYRADLLKEVEAQGTLTHSVEEGFSVLERILAEGRERVVAARLAPQVWQALGETAPAVPAGSPRLALGAALAVREVTPSMTAAEAEQAVGALILAGVTEAFSRRGVLPAAGESIALDAIASAWPVLPRHRKLLEALVDILARGGAISRVADRIVVRERPAGISLDAARAQLAAQPGAAPALALLDACLGSLPGVLAGEVPGTDVLFPGGSMERVAALYANQPTLAYCGRLVASAVVGALKDLEKGGRERPVMVEIGAGTGSATGEVLAAIEAAGLAVAYHYTDVSPGFVRHGKATFAGPDRHFEVLDIEKPPSAQGFARRQRRHRRRGQRPPRHARDRPDTGARGRAAPPRRASRPRRADGARRFRDRHLRSSRRLVARHRSRSAPRARPAPGRAVLAGGVPTGRPRGRWCRQRTGHRRS